MNNKKIVTLLLAGIIGFSTLLSPIVSAEAGPDTISEYESLISELNSEENNLSKKLEKIQDAVKENEEEAEKLVSKMKVTETTLSKLKEEIKGLKIVIKNRELLLQDQARGLQIVGESGNVVNFVLKAESLSEVVGRVDVVNKIVTSNKQTMDKQEEDKSLIEGKEKETIEKQEEQMKIAGKLESNKALLEEQKAEQESVLAKVAAERAFAQSDRESLVAKARAAEEKKRTLESVRSNSNSESKSSSGSESKSSSGSESKSSSGSESKSSSGSESKSVSSSDSKTVSVSSSSEEAAPSGSNGSVVGIANSLKGVSYSYGGTTTSGFDCSGFTSYAFNGAGRSLPRTAAGQYAATSRISRDQAKAGDLVFFSQGSGIDHVGIYLGGGKFVGSQSSTGVATSTIDSGYWSNYLVGFGR